MTDVGEESLRQLDAVRRDFEVRIGGMMDEIVLAWEAAKGAPDRTVAMTGLINLVHRLAGNAGFFGFNMVSRAATSLEVALDRWLAAAAPDRNDTQNLAQLVRTMRSTVPF